MCMVSPADLTASFLTTSVTLLQELHVRLLKFQRLTPEVANEDMKDIKVNTPQLVRLRSSNVVRQEMPQTGDLPFSR